MFKSKLQELCQRKSWSLPEYDYIREGPHHNPRFTSTIIVNGVSFESPLPCRTVKEAQNTAAKVAFDYFSLPNTKPPSSSSSSSSSTPPFPTPKFPPLPQPSLPHTPSLEGFSLPGLSFRQPSLSGLSFPQPSLPGISVSQPVAAATSSSGSPGPSIDVDNILPTRSVLRPKLLEACQTSQIDVPVTGVKDIKTAEDQKHMSHLFKNQLQTYAQKMNIKLPEYSSECEGPPHAIHFKCKVIIGGQTFESSESFPRLKDAEHAAAKVALMSLSPGGAQEDDTVLYKNLLQELVQKEGFSLPVYSTNKSGGAHMPVFVSQVDVEGELFTGQEAKTKKQAEMSAAKVAFMMLKERKAHQVQARDLSSASSDSNFTIGLQHHANSKSPIRSSPGLVTQNQSDKDKAHQSQAREFSSAKSESKFATGLQHHANPKSPVSSSPGLVTQNRSDKNKEPVVAASKKGPSTSSSKNGCTEDSSLSSNQSAPSLSNCTNVVTATSDNKPSTEVGTASRRNKVAVYSRKTNAKIAEGGTLLPISDDNWAAYSYSQ